MTPRSEAWIALLLVGLAATGAAVALIPRADHLEETCGPALPRGRATDLRIDDRVAYAGDAMTRTVTFAARAAPERVVLTTCLDARVEVERDASAAGARVEIVSGDADADRLVEDAEVRMHGVLDAGTLHLVPRLTLHGRTTLPALTFVLTLPPGVAGDVEAWP